MNEGFIKLHRKMFEWEWADDPTVFYFFVKLLLMVNYKDKQWHTEVIQRGQVLTSIAKLCDYTSLSRNAVMRCIEALKKTGEINETVRPNKYRIITVTNYNLYQGSVVPLKDNSRDNKRDNKRGNKKDNCKDNSRGTTKEYKEVSLSPTGIEIRQEEKNPASPGVAESSTDLPSVKEMRTFAEEIPGSDDSMACRFLYAFEVSGTRMPKSWKELYRRFVGLDYQQSHDFLDKVTAGEFRKKWGSL